MKAFARHSTFLVLLSLLLAPLAVSHASPPLDFEQREHDHRRPAAKFDYEQWRRAHPRPAGKLAQGASPEYIVRIIYIPPSDHPPLRDIDTRIDALIKHVQRFYADEMERHGFGRKTFRLETDAAGKAVIHHLTRESFDEQLAKSNNIAYLVWEDIRRPDELDSQVGGYASVLGPHGGVAWSPAINFDMAPKLLYIRAWTTIAHELGHVFGLPHDFRDDRYIMSYGSPLLTDQLSQCAAEWLDAHRYFNTSQTSFDSPTAIQMLPASLASPPNAIRLRFSVTDPDGLHQARLVTDVTSSLEEHGTRGLDCKSLNGESGTIELEFVTTEFAARSEYVGLEVIDMHGNFTQQQFEIDVTSLRLSSEVVSIPDAELAAAIREELNLASGAVITQLDMLDLTSLNADKTVWETGQGRPTPYHNIADLTGLEHATNLKYVLISKNRISDLTPLAGLKKLRSLSISFNQISDIRPLAGLKLLSSLGLDGNQISDIRPLAELKNLTGLGLRAQGNCIISCFLPWGYVAFVRCMELRFMFCPVPLARSVFYALILFGVAGLFGRYPRPAYRAVSSASLD